MRGDILVVDDEAGPRESLRMILKNDHEVRTATSGQEALAEVERHKPDLVFLDLRMPGMEGTEVMQRIRDRWPDVQVAIITAFAAVESARMAVRCGAIDYLTKPYSVAEVLRVVDKALSARRQQHDADVLAAQLGKMAETLGSWARSLEAGRQPAVADAVDSLKTVQSTLPRDLESVSKLTELGEVAAEVTHDINNLLTVILANSQYLLLLLDSQADERLRSRGDPAAVTSRVSRIVRAAEDCSTIIRRVKDFVRLNVSFRPSLININDLVSSAVDLKRGMPTPGGVSVEYVLRLESVPPVYGDEVALRTVLVNLIENSLEALEGSGTIELSTGFADHQVFITVRDTGKGMPPDVLERAKEAFFSAGKPHGTGLGLSTADRVMKRHGGDLNIESTEGLGTTVTILLPLGAPTATEAGPPILAEIPVDHEGTILLVDDEDGMREVMATVLEAEGYRVLRARDGQAGWDCFQREYGKNDADRMLVITDHEMPLLLGRDLARRIKETDRTVPVMIVSGYITEHTGPEDMLMAKPFDVGEFLQSVRQLMGARGS